MLENILVNFLILWFERVLYFLGGLQLVLVLLIALPMQVVSPSSQNLLLLCVANTEAVLLLEASTVMLVTRYLVARKLLIWPLFQ